ncbi:sensor histidine kinase [Pseudoluteimonas lycopersici]|jgi:two-component system sensor histidine kinase DesK|uniref:Sensor histidine kinase n=1 Tax=Pseudoluteimonas lycopersici TaxID=1324796 RepID=A0A516V718_9GAMM|nr:sensor histidine kinase [Lysobacter lycopersici]QDQ74317.1 sensor histidine kinase [Lysobacter lycopersici]
MDSTQRLRSWFRPAPDSHLADAMRRGKSPRSEFIHLLWSVWVFITPSFGMGYDRLWLSLTLLSYPLFLLLYAKTFVAPRRQARWYSLAMVALSMALLRWYPSGLSYFVFGCVLLAPSCRDTRGGLAGYLALVLVLGAAVVAEALWIGYPWQSVVWLPPMTLIIGLIVGVEQRDRAHQDALQLSHDEVRRLAATAERERIGRDLHDLLGHTLSLITLKLELSRKLIDRDAAAARSEIAEAEKVARHALAEVRAAVTGFRAADLAAELASARLLLESSRVALDYDAPPELSPEIERPLALVLREAATNIARHANATRAEVRFVRNDAQLRMRIADDGRGANAGEGNGVVGMRERVRAIGGSFEFASSKAGTAVEVAVPLAAKGQPA